MKKPVAILSIALLVTTAAATSLWLQLRDERAQLAALQARMSALAATPAPDQPILPQAVAAGSTAVGAPASAKPAPAAPNLAAIEDLKARMAKLDEQRMKPENFDIRRAQMQRVMAMQYPDIGKVMHLSPEEVNKLIELLATQQIKQGDALPRTADGSPDRANLQEGMRKFEEVRRANTDELAAALGTSYPQWQDYEKTLPVRRQVSELQTVLGSGDNGLADAQAESLIAALAVERARVDQEQRAAIASGANPQEIMQQQMQGSPANTQRMLDIAAAHLNPRQLDSYRRLLDQQNNIARMLSSQLTVVTPSQAGATPAP